MNRPYRPKTNASKHPPNLSLSVERMREMVENGTIDDAVYGKALPGPTMSQLNDKYAPRNMRSLINATSMLPPTWKYIQWLTADLIVVHEETKWLKTAVEWALDSLDSLVEGTPETAPSIVPVTKGLIQVQTLLRKALEDWSDPNGGIGDATTLILNEKKPLIKRRVGKAGRFDLNWDMTRDVLDPLTGELREPGPRLEGLLSDLPPYQGNPEAAMNPKSYDFRPRSKESNLMESAVVTKHREMVSLRSSLYQALNEALSRLSIDERMNSLSSYGSPRDISMASLTRQRWEDALNLSVSEDRLPDDNKSLITADNEKSEAQNALEDMMGRLSDLSDIRLRWRALSVVNERVKLL